MRKLMWCVVIVVFAVTLWMLFFRPSGIDPDAPPEETAPLPPLPVQLSSITLPFSVPIRAVETVLDRVADRAASGSGTIYGVNLNWRVQRGNLNVSGGGDRLSIGAPIGSGHLRFSKTIFGVPAQTTIDVRSGYASVSGRPRLNAAWSVTPNLSADIHLSDAALDVLNLFTVSVGGVLTPHLEKEANEYVADLERYIVREDLLRRAAMDQWNHLCRCLKVEYDPVYWLEVRPVAARASQIRIDHDNIRVQFGIDAEVRMITEETQPDCPFPEELMLEPPEHGSFEILLPAEIDYEALEVALSKRVVGKTFGKNVSVTIRKVELFPYGRALLLKADLSDLSIRVGSVFGARSEGTVYIVAEPRLDVERQSITLADPKLDVDSRNKWVAALGEIAEPWLLRTVSGVSGLNRVVLGPIEKELREKAEALVRALSSDEVRVAFGIDDIRFARLDVGPEHLRVVAAARGHAAVSMETIALLVRGGTWGTLLN